MYFIYNLIALLVSFSLRIVAVFNKKIKLFVEGRKNTFELLQSKISDTDKVIWFHCASLGEFEQGRPVIEQFKKEHPSYKIVLTFFSPSGFEVRKDYELADVVCYLPLDTRRNARRFIKAVNPNLAVFVKYEFWPNILRELKRDEIPTLLVSGIFRENQVFFKGYGAWMRRSLAGVSHFFVQDENSKKWLNAIDFHNVSVSGDTRFDRVYDILRQNNTLGFIEEFKNNHYTLVAGSTWKDDEDLLVTYINNVASDKEKFIIAPHNMDLGAIAALKNSLTKRTVLYSEKDKRKLEEYQVFIIDTVGVLTKIYSYADVAYVGGGFTKSGVHNILEPATFGVPVVVGPNYSKFKEVKDLVQLNGCMSVSMSADLNEILENLKEDKKEREKRGLIAQDYIKSGVGSSEMILKYINNLIK